LACRRGNFPAPALESISVSYCFICMLHLANEKGLALQHAALSGPQDPAASQCPADAGWNLGDFVVSQRAGLSLVESG
jgi:hypothetical protein